MIGRRAVIGLSLLSMLVFCAFAAPSAFATKGTTGVTCVAGSAAAGFEDAHCKTATAEKAKVKFVHETFAATETKVTVTNEKTDATTTGSTNAVLNATVGGLKAVVTCKKVTGSGTQNNTAGPPMNVSGTITTEFSECTATLNKVACESVNGGKAIVTKALTSTPTEAMEVKFAEDEGSFAKFTIKCSGKEFEITVKGSATGIPEGTTVSFTKASTEGVPPESNKVGLFVGGQVAWFEAKTTVTNTASKSGLALTTTET